MIEVGGKYRHYKGTAYVVLAFAKHSETEEGLIIYQDIEHPEKVWARPLEMFEESVEWEGKTVPRFTKIS